MTVWSAPAPAGTLHVSFVLLLTLTPVHDFLPINTVVFPEKKLFPVIVRVPPDTGIVEDGLIVLTEGDAYDTYFFSEEA